MSKKITTIIFDFDGTIADTLVVMLEVAKEIAQERGLTDMSQVTSEYIRNNSVRKLMSIFKVPFYQLPFLVRQGQQKLNGRIGEVKIFPGFSDVLTQLYTQGYVLGILSSNSVKNIKDFLQQNNVERFSFIHSERNIFGKDKAITHVLQKNRLLPDEVIYVGDEIRDVEACHKVGVPVVAVSWGFNSKKLLIDSKPNKIVDTPEELLQYINEL